MRRREFVRALGAAAVAAPFNVRAQEAGRTYRVGGVTASPRNAPIIVAMFDELRRAGFVEGQNLTIDWRTYGANADLIPELTADLVKAHVDVIYAAGDPAICRAQDATKTIPILGITEDMVAAGLVNSLGRPGGNTTGLSILATELDGKRQEILIEVVPGIRHMAVLADPKTASLHVQALEEAARGRDVELSIYRAARVEEILAAIDAAKASGAEAINILSSAYFWGNRQNIMQHVAALHLPAMYHLPEFAEEGGLLAYGPRAVQIFREIMAPQLVKLLRGVKPADLPVLQPTQFELVINLKTSKGLGLAIPESFLVRADKVIE
jgi:putative tryptophan/tyrosine transport system substrate-binding protein